MNGCSEFLEELAIRGVQTVPLGLGPRARAIDQSEARSRGVIKAAEEYVPERHANKLEAAVLHRAPPNNSASKDPPMMHSIGGLGERRRWAMVLDAMWVVVYSFVTMQDVVVRCPSCGGS